MSGAAKGGPSGAGGAKPAGTATAPPRERDSVAELNALLPKARAAAEGPGGPKAALALLDAAAPDVKALGMFHYARGTLLFRAGDAGAALAAFREAVRLDPEVPEYAGNLGAALIARAEAGEPAALDEAIEVLSRAAGGGPKLPLVHANLGLALQKAGRPEEALHAVEAALAIDGKNPPALLGKASLLIQLGEVDEGIATLDALVKVAPDFPAAKAAREAVRKKFGK
jgi:tetratricopeptide (TPR) repeat protein